MPLVPTFPGPTVPEQVTSARVVEERESGFIRNIVQNTWYSLLGPFTPTSAGTVHIHFQRDTGNQQTTSLIFASQFNAAQIVAPAVANVNVMTMFRVLRRSTDGGLYLEGMAGGDFVVVAQNVTCLYTQQGNQNPGLLSELPLAIGGTVLATVAV